MYGFTIPGVHKSNCGFAVLFYFPLGIQGYLTNEKEFVNNVQKMYFFMELRVIQQIIQSFLLEQFYKNNEAQKCQKIRTI